MTQLQHPPILGTSQATWADEAACARDAGALARASARRAARRLRRARGPAGRRQDHVRAPPAARAGRGRPHQEPHLRGRRDLRARRPGHLALRLLPLRRPAGMGGRRPARPVRRARPEAGRMGREGRAAAARARPARDDHATRRAHSRRPIRRNDPERRCNCSTICVHEAKRLAARRQPRAVPGRHRPRVRRHHRRRPHLARGRLHARHDRVRPAAGRRATSWPTARTASSSTSTTSSSAPPCATWWARCARTTRSSPACASARTSRASCAWCST